MSLIKQLEELEASVAQALAENTDLKARQEKWMTKKVALEAANAEFAVAFAAKDKELEEKDRELSAKDKELVEKIKEFSARDKELSELKAALAAAKTDLDAFKKREDAWASRIPKLLAQLSGKPVAGPAPKNPVDEKPDGKPVTEFKVLPPVPAPAPVAPLPKSESNGNGSAHPGVAQKIAVAK